MSEVIKRNGWEVKFTDAGNIEVRVVPTLTNQLPLLDIRPLNHQSIFLIRRRLARGAGDLAATKATDTGGEG